jgi:hypothetical protein
MRRFQRDPHGFVRDIAAMVVFLGLLAFALWAGSQWAGLGIGEMVELPGMICFPILLFGVVFGWWLGEEDS